MTIVQNSVKQTFEYQILQKGWCRLRFGYVCFANSLIASKTWQGKIGGIPPGGLDGEDVVEIVFVKILDNTLHCHEGVEFDAFIKQSIKATVSHLANSQENKHTVSTHFFSRETMSICSILDFVSLTDQCQFEMFPSGKVDLTVDQVISEFLKFIERDVALTKVAKIFVFNGAVFVECFQDIVEAESLINCLVANGYLDEEGEVQYAFWCLGGAKEMKLDKQFEGYRKIIFLIISQSITIEKPRDIARWLNMDISDVYNIKRKMKRYLLRFKNKLGLFNGGNYDEK